MDIHNSTFPFAFLEMLLCSSNQLQLCSVHPDSSSGDCVNSSWSPGLWHMQ